MSDGVNMAAIDKLLELFQTQYTAGFKGIPMASSKVIEADVTVRLPDQPCRFAMLSNFNVVDVPTFTAKGDIGANALPEDDLDEIYYGFGGRICAQLFTGRSTEVFPISNLNLITVRCRPSQSTTVWFAWWV